ncbi:natural product biosynthesis luciferase-like monooxygenase protein [Nonomuraea fuscirosea]|uniref:Natural product biosynthesis luciferase-like monooxygenase protein n=1 Tax=Nonomuraea fuscirosea TaxID=1291556 RepID=A0A2T0MY88_9ACTN|nr:MupA/Atu3671 family FMN-dependent luciferase-like monooxygenase [Nonomuraea fuscirosea]PRX64214.1 natural product biosynthesis luciferase-like monooxygenase protein [Nonomuraea fuscirosea]
MRFSLFYFADDSTQPSADRYELLLEGARYADAHGFTAVWTPERHFHAFGGLYPNSAVTGAAVAAVTERVAVRAGSVVAPLHHPIRIAEDWAVVDNLSGGRVGVSFASGWHAVDFAFNPGGYADRTRITVETLQQVRRLWRGEEVSVVTGVGEEQRVRIFPPPVQPELPVWLTSSGSVETFRTAGALGVGVLTNLLSQSVDELALKIKEYRAGLAGRPGDVVVMLHTHLGPTTDAVREALTAYVRSSVGLHLGSSAGSARDVDPAALGRKGVEFMTRRAVKRFFDEAGLLGELDVAAERVRRLAAIGVDEIACLIDFGLETSAVLGSLDQLGRLLDSGDR